MSRSQRPEITACASHADGLPYRDPGAAHAGQIEQVSSAWLSGWTIEKDGSRATAVSVRLGAHEITNCMPTVSRPEVAILAGTTETTFGHKIRLDTRRTLEILATEFAHGRSAPMRLTAWIPQPSWVDQPPALLPVQTPFVSERTPEDWLDFFGFAIDQNILAARATRYDRIVRIAQPTTDDWRTELYVSSMLNHGAVRLLQPQEPGQRPGEKLLQIHAAEPALPFDEEFVARTLQDRFKIKVDPADTLDLLLTSLKPLDLDPHPLFFSRWYRKQYDIPADRIPWVDYISGGWKCGREPNPLFLTPSIDGLEAASEASDASPLAIYLASSSWSKVRPSPLLRATLTQSDYIAHMATNRLAAIVSPLLSLNHYDGSGEYRDRLENYTTDGEDAGIKPCFLFDPNWYRKTYGHASSLIGPLLHFAWRGEKSLRDPSQYFSTRYYVENNNDVCLHGVRASEHYIWRGHIEPARRPSPLFDQEWYRLQSGGSSYGLSHFLDTGAFDIQSPHPAVIAGPRARGEDLRAALFSSKAFLRPLPFGIESAFTIFPDQPEGTTVANLRCGALASTIRAFEEEVEAFTAEDVAHLKMNEPIVRLYEFFDEARAAKLAADLLSDVAPEEPPLVSVIMPARNRHTVIGPAIRSVLAQSHRNLELIVVDDGSTDGTAAVASAVADARLKVIPIAPSGVSAARNKGLEAAQGAYIAYLDSDNLWSPSYLQTMLAAMRRGSSALAHSALRIFSPAKGEIRFRGAPYDRDALDRESYIDMNVFVHRREFVDEGLRFDETLRRCVDWDFIRRMCLKSGRSEYVPIIGCDYLDDDGNLNRITTSELVGDFYRLSAQQVDLSRHLTGTTRLAPAYAIVWPIHPADEKRAIAEIWRAVHHLRFGAHELVIVNNNLSTKTTAFLAALSRRVAGLRVIHLWRTFMDFPAANLACQITVAERILFWSSHVRYESDRIDAFMAATRGSETRLDFPALVTGADRLTGGLFRVAEDGRDLETVMEGQLRDRRVTRLAGAASMHFPVAVARRDFLAAGGFDTDFSLRLGLAEFAVRAMREGAAVAIRFDHPMTVAGKPAAIGDEANAAKEADFFRSTVALPAGIGVTAPGSEIRVLSGRSATKVEGGRVLRSQTPLALISRKAAQGGLRIMIMCPAPNDHTMQAWGDYHYAASLAEALRRLGHAPVVRLRDFWTAPSPGVDAAIHLHGIVETRRVEGALNLLWIISHPDKVGSDEIRMADSVFVPSEQARKAVYRRFGTDSAVMPQATDPERFAFLDAAPLPELADRLIFIGNSRQQPRRIVLDAAQMQLPLDIYGRDWSYYVDQSLIRGDYVSNSQVAGYYRSAMCVLNDHWPSMASHGIISNRLYDVVAAGGIAISDEVEGLDATFQGQVRSYRTRSELADLIRDIPDWAPAIPQRREIAHELLRLHSFDVRARQFVDFILAAR